LQVIDLPEEKFPTRRVNKPQRPAPFQRWCPRFSRRRNRRGTSRVETSWRQHL
jgi:hypothetical protein